MLGKRIKLARKASGMSLRALAERAGLDLPSPGSRHTQPCPTRPVDGILPKTRLAQGRALRGSTQGESPAFRAAGVPRPGGGPDRRLQGNGADAPAADRAPRPAEHGRSRCSCSSVTPTYSSTIIRAGALGALSTRWSRAGIPESVRRVRSRVELKWMRRATP